VCDPVVALAAAPLHRDQPSVAEPREVGRGQRRRRARTRRELASRKRLTAEQRQQHGGAPAVADQSGDGGEVGIGEHVPIVTLFYFNAG
jgi:hypothetical protein